MSADFDFDRETVTRRMQTGTKLAIGLIAGCLVLGIVGGVIALALRQQEAPVPFATTPTRSFATTPTRSPQVLTVDEVLRDYPKIQGEKVRVTGPMSGGAYSPYYSRQILLVYLMGERGKIECIFDITAESDFAGERGQVTIEGNVTTKNPNTAVVTLRRCKRILP